MTTVDVYIQDTNDNAHLLSFHNGLVGPATEVMCRVHEAVEHGEARHERDLDSLVPGNVLRRILAGAELDGDAFSGSATPEQLRHFLDAVLSDEATYRVTCIDC
jgi:hypothetical protein